MAFLAEIFENEDAGSAIKLVGNESILTMG